MNHCKNVYVVMLNLLFSSVVMHTEPGREDFAVARPLHDDQTQEDEFSKWHASVSRPHEIAEKREEEKSTTKKPSVWQRVKDRFSFHESSEKPADVALSNKVDDVKNSIQKSFDRTWDSIVRSATSAKQKLSSIQDALTKSVDDMIDRVTDFFDLESTPSAERMIRNEFRQLRNDAKTMMGEVTDSLGLSDGSDFDALKKKTSKFFSKLGDRIQNVVADVTAKLRKAARDVKKAIR